MNRKLLFCLPLALVLLAAAFILALPAFVGAKTHRARIEALASALTGRSVHIAGRLSLGLFPTPELTASRVTITGPDHEIITARALALDVSLPALLRGQLSASNLVLDAPRIAFPWPLPGGPKAITPPPWLAALHAQIRNGDISVGAARFAAVNADLFTGADGAVTISGTGKLAGHDVAVSLALAPIQLTGTAPLTLDASSGDYSLHFSGGLGIDSALTGQLGLAAPQLSGSAHIAATGTDVTASALQLTDASTTLTGTASFDFPHPALSADLAAAGADLPTLRALTFWPGIPLTLHLTATNLAVDGATLPVVQASLDVSPAGLTLHSLQATLAGSTTLAAQAQISPQGAIAGKASLSSPDLPDLFASAGLTAPAGWISGHLSAGLAGSQNQIGLRNLTGAIDGDTLTGNLVLTAGHAAGILNFDRLDLAPLISWLAHRPEDGFSADGQITASRATLGPVPLTHLLLDASLTRQINIRRVSANVFGGLAAGSLSLGPDGAVIAAHGLLSLPSAAPLSALLPARWQPPAALAQARLNLALFAQGPPDALATSAVATLGDFTLTAAPVLNLAQASAAGPLSLRHPDAIKALKIFGLAPSLAWPGAGSVALRASFTASPTQIGLPDFVLSLGAFTANGRLLRTQGVLSGAIDADTLALPPLSPTLNIPWPDLATAHGNLAFSANRVLYAGQPVLGGMAGSLTLAPATLTLKLDHAALAGGGLSGQLRATASTAAPPSLSAQFSADHLDAAQLDLGQPFPFTLATGAISAAGNLTATGYSPKIWAATLAGTLHLNAANGTLGGFSLRSLKAALIAKTRSQKLRAALASGTSAFTNLTLAGTLAQGNCTLNLAALSGPDGTATATGSIDIFDRDLALRLLLHPLVTPPLAIGTTVLGSWGNPQQYPRLKPALSWTPGA